MGLKPITYKIDENGCHICISHYGQRYPKIKRNGKTIILSRFIYSERFGPIPEGMVIRHKCDNTFCINVEHLELGSVYDSIKDRNDRGRTAKGERVGNCKLTENQVRTIQTNLRTTTDIAKDYGVAQQLISRVKLKQCWRHLW